MEADAQTIIEFGAAGGFGALLFRGVNALVRLANSATTAFESLTQEIEAAKAHREAHAKHWQEEERFFERLTEAHA